MYFAKSIAAFIVVGGAVTYVYPLNPPTPMQQFGGCISYPQGSDARAQCVREHFEMWDKYTGSATSQIGMRILHAVDLDPRLRLP